jgi:NTP pyrophosphatase (non-canonical NTP hydrolase)
VTEQKRREIVVKFMKKWPRTVNPETLLQLLDALAAEIADAVEDEYAERDAGASI